MADKVHISRESPRHRQRATWRGEYRTLQTPRFIRDMVVAGLALVFSILFIWYSRNTGHSFWVYWAPFFLAGGALLLGIPVYLGQRRHMSQPAPVPPYREVERGG
jgi:APA family basic amino acid/polyamine antiporter